MFAGDIRRQRVSRMRGFRHCGWHLDEIYVKLNGEMVYLWRAVDHEGEVLESYVASTRDKGAALTFIKKALKRHGSPEAIATDGLRSYSAAMDELGCRDRQAIGRWANNRVENSHLPFRRRELALGKFRRMKTLQKFALVHAASPIASPSNATSSTAPPTRTAARPRWPSGDFLRAERSGSKPDLHAGKTSSHWTDSTRPGCCQGRLWLRLAVRTIRST